jgi:hypothetical protein
MQRMSWPVRRYENELLLVLVANYGGFALSLRA